MSRCFVREHAEGAENLMGGVGRHEPELLAAKAKVERQLRNWSTLKESESPWERGRSSGDAARRPHRAKTL